MTDKLRAVRARFENIFQFDEYEFELGKWTILKGPNNVGKTNALEAIRWLWAGEAHDARVLRKGQKRGEATLLLSDGVELMKRTLEGRTFLVVRVPKLGEIKRAPRYVKELLGDLSLNPIAFLTAKPADQKQMFLRSIPMHVTREQLTAAVGFAITQPVEGHALDVIAAAEKMFYSDRTEKNRALKQKQSAALQLTESLPQAPPDGDWPTEVKRAEQRVQELKDELLSKKEEARKVAAEAKLHIDKQLDGALRDLDTLFVAPLIEWGNKAQHARTMTQQMIKSESARKLAAQFLVQVGHLVAECEDLTRGIEGLRTLRTKLTTELPIPGLEIGEDELLVDRIPMSRVEESRRIRIAVELALLGAGELGLVMVDGLEALDDNSLALFKTEIARYDAQVLGTRVVSPDPTRPETLGLQIEREE